MNNPAYFEIQADDPQRAVSFYADVFGWKCTKEEYMPLEYWRIETEGMNGAILKRPAGIAEGGQGTNAYVCSMLVEYFDAKADVIIKHGGAVALPKFAVPGKCWQGYFLDTEGNTFGLFQIDENAA